MNFKVHGSKGDLFGDGLAIWYTQSRGELGSVFGSKDYFRGLSVFLDTYSNHNGPHSVCCILIDLFFYILFLCFLIIKSFLAYPSLYYGYG